MPETLLHVPMLAASQDPAEPASDAPTTAVESLFSGRLASTVVCGACCHTSTQLERFMCALAAWVPHTWPAFQSSSQLTACYAASKVRWSICAACPRRDLSLPVASVAVSLPTGLEAATPFSGADAAAAKPPRPLSAKQRKAAAKQASMRPAP